ncbi:MAG: ATP-dependent Clp protease proteolytic subunit [Reyranellaceae bacterium]
MISLAAAILGVAPLSGVDARCAMCSPTTRIHHRGRPLAGAEVFVVAKGKNAAIAFAIPEESMPREALLDCLAGDLGARLDMRARQGVATVKAAHLVHREGAAAFWEGSSPRRTLANEAAKWHSAVTLGALGVRRDLPAPGDDGRPDGASVVRLELTGQVSERSAKVLLPKIAAARDCTIVLRIDSNGGNAYAGERIYAALLAHPRRVEVDIAVKAHSAASLIAMAGDIRRMSARASMLLHESFLHAKHMNASNGRALVKALELSADRHAAIYALRAGKPLATAREWTRRSSLFSALEATRVGLVHEVMTESGGVLFTSKELRLHKDGR